MLSKNKQKLLRLLASKKHRDELGLFIAEGPKVVGDLLGKVPCQTLFGTREWLSKYLGEGTDAGVAKDAGRRIEADEVIEVTQDELERASLLKTPRDVLAVFRRPQDTMVGGGEKTGTAEAFDTTHGFAQLAAIPAAELTLALDGVQDPGNLGTIIRIADWFGITHIFCSLDTADAYSPKTIQATMGAIARVRVHYVQLPAFLASCGDDVPVYGTFLDGTDLYAQPLTAHGIIVMGNEGNGISPAVGAAVNRRLFIPSFPPDRPTSESLNVAIATAITCAEFRRRS